MKTSTINSFSICLLGAEQAFRGRLSTLHYLFFCLLLSAGSFFISGPAVAGVKCGEILVTDELGGTNQLGALIAVDSTTGQRRVVSDFGDSAQGALSIGGTLRSVAVGPHSKIYVSDLFSGDPAFGGGAIFRVGPVTGKRVVVSNFSQGNIDGPIDSGLAIDLKGNLFVNVNDSDAPFLFALVKVNPNTDVRTLILDPEVNREGRVIMDLARLNSGKILTYTIGTSGPDIGPKIISVHPVTGKERVVSDFANPLQGPDMSDKDDPMRELNTGIVQDGTHSIIVAAGAYEPPNYLLRINLITGRRIVLTDFGDANKGSLGFFISGVAIDNNGKVLAIAHDIATGGALLFRVDPVSGQRSLLSDFGNPAQGVLGSAVGPRYMAVMPKCKP